MFGDRKLFYYSLPDIQYFLLFLKTVHKQWLVIKLAKMVKYVI